MQKRAAAATAKAKKEADDAAADAADALQEADEAKKDAKNALQDANREKQEAGTQLEASTGVWTKADPISGQALDTEDAELGEGSLLQ